jgi:hypothetical protein
MRVYVKFPIIKNGGVSYPCLIFSNYLLVSFSGAIIITPSSSEVNTETRQYKTYLKLFFLRRELVVGAMLPLKSYGYFLA